MFAVCAWMQIAVIERKYKCETFVNSENIVTCYMYNIIWIMRLEVDRQNAHSSILI
jgi:hypothetical protein